VVHPGLGTRLAQEALDNRALGSTQELERHLPAQHPVPGTVDNAHAPLAQEIPELVAQVALNRGQRLVGRDSARPKLGHQIAKQALSAVSDQRGIPAQAAGHLTILHLSIQDQGVALRSFCRY
jgi:hypothetical protein